MEFTGVVLAGGLSSRMGSDKADLKIEQTTFQAHSRELLEQVGACNVLISKNKTGFMEDIYPNNGPLGGIYTALENSQYDLLISAVDMPLVTHEVLITLVKIAQHKTHAAYFYKNHPLPVYLKNTKKVKKRLKAILLTPNSNKSIKHFLKIIGACACDNPLESCLINVNTPSEFMALK